MALNGTQARAGRGVSGRNFAAVESWLPAAHATAEAVKDDAAACRLLRLVAAGKLPARFGPALARLRGRTARRADRAAAVSARARAQAFGPGPV